MTVPNMHLLNPPSPDEIFFLKKKGHSIYKIQVECVLSDDESMIVDYKIWYDIFEDLDHMSYGRISLHHWNCWLLNEELVKINSSKEELAYIIKYSGH